MQINLQTQEKQYQLQEKKYYEEDCHSKLFDDVLCDVMKEYGIDFEIIEHEEM